MTRTVKIFTLAEFTFQWGKLINKRAHKDHHRISAVTKRNRIGLYGHFVFE